MLGIWMTGAWAIAGSVMWSGSVGHVPTLYEVPSAYVGGFAEWIIATALLICLTGGVVANVCACGAWWDARRV